jgi:hypothetical protein
MQLRFAPLALLVASACTSSASARLQLTNQTAAARRFSPDVLADGTSMRLKLISVYLAQDVDPTTMDNIGDSSMIWLNPECNGDISDCNVAGMALPAGPRITQYFDLARPTDEVNTELNSQDAPIDPATYRYARVELCKAYAGQSQATVPTMMWKGPDMASEQAFTSGDCGRTSLPFDPPLVIAAGDAVTVSLGYDLSTAIVAGAPAAQASFSIAGHDDAGGQPHTFRACVDVDADHRDCMDFPELSPSAAKL